MLIEFLILIPSIGVTLLFFMYGFNIFYLINAARKYRVPKPTVPGSNRPQIAIHLPIYNEKYVIDRLLDAVLKVKEVFV